MCQIDAFREPNVNILKLQFIETSYSYSNEKRYRKQLSTENSFSFYAHKIANKIF